jgi:hypothetical protein
LVVQLYVGKRSMSKGIGRVIRRWLLSFASCVAEHSSVMNMGLASSYLSDEALDVR